MSVTFREKTIYIFIFVKMYRKHPIGIKKNRKLFGNIDKKFFTLSACRTRAIPYILYNAFLNGMAAEQIDYFRPVVFQSQIPRRLIAIDSRPRIGPLLQQ